MSDACLPSVDKEALSPTPQPMYLRASALPDLELEDSVERCLLVDLDECSSDASDTCKARKKRPTCDLSKELPSRAVPIRNDLAILTQLGARTALHIALPPRPAGGPLPHRQQKLR